jgi:hypothetical protein
MVTYSAEESMEDNMRKIVFAEGLSDAGLVAVMLALEDLFSERAHTIVFADGKLSESDVVQIRSILTNPAGTNLVEDTDFIFDRVE